MGGRQCQKEIITRPTGSLKEKQRGVPGTIERRDKPGEPAHRKNKKGRCLWVETRSYGRVAGGMHQGLFVTEWGKLQTLLGQI